MKLIVKVSKLVLRFKDLALLSTMSVFYFAFSFLSSNLGNIAKLETRDVLSLLLFNLVIVLFTLVGTLIVYAALRSFHKKVNFRIIFTLFLLMNFIIGIISRSVASYLGMSPDSNRLFLLVFIMLAFVLVVLMVSTRNLHNKIPTEKLVKALSFGLLLMTLIPTLSLVNARGTTGQTDSIPEENELRSQGYFEWFDLEKGKLNTEAAKKSVGKYDVYYLILDGYPSFEIQKDLYGIDDGMKEYFEDKGFYIANQSRANYQESFMSIPSLLRMKYFHEELTDRYGTSNDQSLARSWMKQNETVQLYKNAGFKFASLSPWNEIDASAYDDFNFVNLSTSYLKIVGNSVETSDLQTTYTKNSILKPLDKFVVGTNKGTGSLEALKTTESIANDSESTFSLIYSWLPHPPPFFDADGKPVQDPYTFEPDSRLHWSGEGYIKNIEVLNKQLVLTLDSILANSKKGSQEPIILIASDHGTANLLNKYNHKLDESIKLDDAINERYKNFAAFYFPNKKYAKLEDMDKISPVNYGRVILNEFISQKLPMLENRAYYSEEFYNFEEVTNIVWE